MTHGPHSPTDRPGAAPRLSTLQWSTRLIAGVAALAVLVWAWNTSAMDPGVLVENATKAREYVFGRPLGDDEKQRLRDRAEQTVGLRLLDDAQAALRSEMGLTVRDPEPEGFAEQAGARARERRESMTVGEWEAMVEREYSRNATNARGGYFPPESSPDRVGQYAVALLETVAIAIWGTLLAVLVALPASLLGSRRSLAIIAPGDRPRHRLARWASSFVGRRGFDTCRGFNEFVLALILVAVIGLGPFAGVLALAIHTFGVLGKVFADAIEAVRKGEIEGVTATGASSVQVISYALLPQIMPYVVSQTLLRFESNVRSASVLGIVGAGGIGFLIDAKLKAYQYREVATMMILIIVVVSLIDFVCGRIMKRFV